MTTLSYGVSWSPPWMARSAAAPAVTADSLVTENWFLALTGAVLIALLVMRTGTEEQRLIARFGDGYTDYMGRTGRFLPRLRG